jgi:membrane-bound ClpP family serine protease
MTAIVLLFVTGALLLAAEVALPGAVAGIAGGIALLAGSVMTFSEFGAMAGTLATLGAVLLVGLMLYVELIWLPRTRLGRALVVEATVAGQSQPPPASGEIVGQLAQAETALVPTGYVTVAGRRYEAFCRSGHAVRGAMLTVVGVDNFRVIVSATPTS